MKTYSTILINNLTTSNNVVLIYTIFLQYLFVKRKGWNACFNIAINCNVIVFVCVIHLV